MVRAKDGSPEVNAWVVIKPDDTVVVRIARSEMGQGTLTGLAQMVAEELECDWTKVTWEYPTPGANVARNRVWGDYSTGGSRGIRTSHEYVRKGGAAARMMLIQAAANEWKVPASECTAANSVITHKASNRTTTFGKVAEAAAKLEAPKDVPLKDPKDWKIIGKSMKRLDTLDKVTGKQVYGADLKLPNMLNASIIDCPVFGGKVKSFDAAAAEKMPGVKKVVQVGDTARRGGGRHLVAGQDRARQGEDRVGRRRQRQGLERVDRRDPDEGPRCRAGLHRQREGQRQGRDRQGRQEGRGGLLRIRTRTTPRWSR